MGNPNKKPPTDAPSPAPPKNIIVTTPEMSTSAVPNIEIPKALLFNEHIPAVSPNAKARIPKTPMKNHW